MYEMVAMACKKKLLRYAGTQRLQEFIFLDIIL